MNRLLAAVQDGQEEKYAYDPVGNRLKKESVQGIEIYHYNAKNQLTHIQSGADTLRYRYDKQENLLEEQGKAKRKQYAYDTANRQVSVASAGADGAIGKLLQSNRYDGEGLRYETEENGKVIRFLFDRGELAQEKQEDEEISYVRGYHPISLSRSGKDRNYFVQDEMGSTLFLLDQDHEIRKTYRYDAFGNLLKETGDIPNRLTYTGQIYDGAAIQYYLRARFYNPAIGRFMQEDTYRGDGLNLYAYCANNPVIYYDPSGHILLSPIRATEPANDERVYSGDLMSPDEAARYSEYWRKLGIGSDETWNEYLKYNPDGTIDDYFNIIKNESPWPSGYNPVEVTLYPGDTFEMALGVGQSPTTPGRFATPTGSITDFDYVRNDLAVKEAWKPDVDRVVVYQVKDDVMLLTLQGPVGSQIDLGNNTYLRGGAEQINILLDRSIDAMDYLNILSINSIYK